MKYTLLHALLFACFTLPGYANTIVPFDHKGLPQQKPLDWHTIPSMFVKSYQLGQFDVIVKMGDKDLGTQSIHVDTQRHQVQVKRVAFLRKLSLKKAAYAFLSKQFKQGMPLDKPLVCNMAYAQKGWCQVGDPVAIASLNLQTLTLQLWLNPMLFALKHKNAHYLSLPDQRFLSSVLSYSFNANTQSSINNSVYSLAANDLLSYGEYRMQVGGNVAGGQGDTQAQLGNVRLTKDFQKYRVSAGYANTSYFSSAPGRSLQYGFSGQGFMAAFSSSNNLLLDQSRGSLTPINLFFNQTSTVRVYKNGDLVSVQHFNAGANQLDTTTFASGVYPVKVEVWQNGHMVSNKTYTINKPFDMSGLSLSRKDAFSVWGGMVRQNENQQFTLPYAGFDYKRILTPHIMANMGGYIVKDMAVSEFDSTIMLPWQIHMNESFGIDRYANYGFNISASKSLSHIFSVSTYYNRGQRADNNSKNALSPFYTNNQIGGSASVSLYDWSLGSFSFSYSHDLHAETNNFNVYYQVSLFQRGGLSINASASDSWSTGANAISANNYTIGLGLTYHLSDGSYLSENNTYQPHSGALSSNVGWHRSGGTNHFISNVAANVNHTDYGDVVGASAGVNASWAQGFVAVNHTLGHAGNSSVSTSLDGNIIMTPHSVSVQKQSASSGVVVEMQAEPGQALLANINGATYPIHSGKNFIPLDEYQEYDFYLNQPKNSTKQYTWQQQDAHFTLFPGNVFYINRAVTPVVEIIGQLVDQGKPVAQAHIHSSVEDAYTDQAGYFTIAVKQSYPSLTWVQGKKSCGLPLKQQEIAHADMGHWVGTLHCKGNHEVI